MRVNVWVALRDDAQSAIVTRLTWDENTQGPYTGPVSDETALLFSRIKGFGEVQRLFRVATINSRQWTLWNLFYSGPTSTIQKVQDELDQLAIDYPSQFIIGGAWIWDHPVACRQVGTQLVISTRQVDKQIRVPNPDFQPDDQLPNYDPVRYTVTTIQVPEEYASGHTGTPTYPIPANLIELMPDVDDVGTRPTELSDVNLMQGQPPREFS